MSQLKLCFLLGSATAEPPLSAQPAVTRDAAATSPIPAPGCAGTAASQPGRSAYAGARGQRDTLSGHGDSGTLSVGTGTAGHSQASTPVRSLLQPVEYVAGFRQFDVSS